MTALLLLLIIAKATKKGNVEDWFADNLGKLLVSMVVAICIDANTYYQYISYLLHK